MNAEEAVRKIFDVLGDVNRILRHHAMAMERRPRVKSTATKLEVINYQSGPMIEGFVEAEMDDGTALCWCLDITWTDEAFNVEATLDRNSSGGGSETLKRVPVRVLRDLGEFPEGLTDVTRALLALGSA